MTTNLNGFAARTSVTAVRGALIAMVLAPAAFAADPSTPDPAVVELTQPASTVEVGVGHVNTGSYKFGEYNGLQRSGPYAIGNVDLRGGGSYNSDDPTRWRIKGTDLGLETRDVSAEYGQQGSFRVNLGYDELRRNRSDTYQTPYLGQGGNVLTLPSNWIRPIVPQLNANMNLRGLSPITGQAPYLVTSSGTIGVPTPAQVAASNTLLGADLPDFHNVNLSTKRTRVDGGFSFNIDAEWELKASARHEEKYGYKPMSTVTNPVTEFAAVIPDLIDQRTDQMDASINFKNQKSYFQIAYYGSLFRNNIKSMSWQDIADPTKFATMSSAPSNQFHQLSATGGYNFSSTTKLVLNGSIARNTQNDTFLFDSALLPLGLPTSSLNGVVVSTAFGAKLTAKPIKDLNVAVGYKYNDRDNRTPVNIYDFYDIGEAKSGVSAFNPALGSNINIYANRPYSKKVNQFDADADYRIAKGQTIKGSYEYQQIDRTCPGSWYNCADAPTTKENTLRAEWHGNMVEDLSGRVAYAYSRRTVNYDENAFLAVVPMANVIPSGGATTSAYGFLTQTGIGAFGPVAPYVPLQAGNLGIFFPNNSALPQALYGSRNDIQELPGMRRYNMANRNRDKLRSSVDWQPTDKLSLQGVLDYNQDRYSDSVYGLKNAKNWALDLDASYAVSENFSTSAFYTYEDQKSGSAGDSYSAGAIANTAFVGQAANTLVSGGCFNTVSLKNQNAKVDPCLNWSTDMHDKVDTVGLDAKLKGLWSGRIDLTGGLAYSRARTDIGLAGGTYANNPFALAAPAPALAAGVPAAFYIPAAGLPTITTNTLELRLGAQVAIDKVSSVRLVYIFQRLKSSDYAYDGMQYGTITAVLPTNEQAPNYRVHVIGVSYEKTFR